MQIRTNWSFGLLTLLVVFIFCFDYAGVVAQGRVAPQQDRSFYHQFGESLYFETAVMPKNNSDSADVYFSFRIMYDVLGFSKLPSLIDGKAFSAIPSIMVELRNEEGITVLRKGWSDSVLVETFEQTNSKTDFSRGSIVAALPVGKYTTDIVLSDKENSQIRKLRMKPFSVPKKTALWFSPMMFGELSNDFHPYIFSGDLPFSPKKKTALLAIQHTDSQNGFSYRLRMIPSSETDHASWGTFTEKKGLAELKPHTTFSPRYSEKHLGQEMHFSIQTDKESNIGLAAIPLPQDSMPPGRYNITVFASGNKDSVSYDFEVIWENMPLSLKRVSYAAEAMYYILADEDYDYLNSGSDEEKRNKIMEYWKKKDPTPNTAFNEAMAEYFRRVDYAFFNYQTMTENDGAKTQRGKIYILFGNPDYVEKKLIEDSKVEERWIYSSRAKKEFIFEKNGSSPFKLKKTNNL